MGVFLLVVMVILYLVAEIKVIVLAWGPMGPGLILLLMILTAMLGWRLIKRGNLGGMLMSVQFGILAGDIPLEVMETLLIFVAGILLLLPGIIGDHIGFLLLIGPVRRAVGRFIIPRLRDLAQKGMEKMMSGAMGGADEDADGADDGVIDVEAIEVEK